MDCGKEAEEVLDTMREESASEPMGDYYDQLDPHGDHPEAIALLREQHAAENARAIALPAPPDMGAPEGMSGLDAPVGVIGG